MRAVIQRVQTASVAVKGDQIGTCDAGMLILICAMLEDTPEHAEKLASKIAKLRIFADIEGRMNKSLLDIDGSALVISQFTLAADTKRGNRPGFSRAAPPELGRQLYEIFAKALADLGPRVETGRFGADMQVNLINDGPVTIWIDTEAD